MAKRSIYTLILQCEYSIIMCLSQSNNLEYYIISTEDLSKSDSGIIGFIPQEYHKENTHDMISQHKNKTYLLRIMSGVPLLANLMFFHRKT